MSEEKSVARFGYVSDYDAARHMARIQFPDKNNLVSGWIPVAVRNSLKNHDEHHLDIGEHVFCVMQGNGTESGCVLCAVYDDTNKSHVGNKDKRSVTFDDGTQIIYDRAAKKLEINCSGDIEITAQSLNENLTNGAKISYDANSGQMLIKSPGDIDILSEKTITIKAKKIDIQEG